MTLLVALNSHFRTLTQLNIFQDLNKPRWEIGVHLVASHQSLNIIFIFEHFAAVTAGKVSLKSPITDKRAKTEGLMGNRMKDQRVAARRIMLVSGS